MAQPASETVARQPVLSVPRLIRLNARWLWVLFFLALLIWSLVQAGVFDHDLVNARGWRLFSKFLQASLHPELSSDFLKITLDATFQTLSYAVLGTVLSLCIGLIGGLLASEIWWQTVLPPKHGNREVSIFWFRLPWLIIRLFLAVPRAIHEVIWGLFFLNIFGLNPLTAILALGIHFGASTAKVFSEIFDEAPRGAFDALRTSGAAPFKAFVYGLLPQAIPNMVAYGFYRFESAIRASAILGVIGAGGLGYQIYLSLQSIEYGQLWTLFYALFLLSGITDLWSSLLRHSLKGIIPTTYTTLETKAILATSATKDEINVQKQAGNRVPAISMLLFLGLIIFSVWYVKLDLGIFATERTRHNFVEITSQLFPPNLTSNELGKLFDLSGQTLAMSVLAITLASTVGLLLSFPAARNISLPGGISAAGRSNRWRWLVGGIMLFASRAILLVVRAIPPSIWALVLMFVLFPGIVPGAVALGIAASGILGRQLAETTENLDSRPLRALQAQGAPAGSVFLYGILPAALPQFLTYILYRWEVCVRETIIVGLVGAGGLGHLFNEQLTAFDYHSILTTLLFIVGLTFLVDMLSNLVRRSTR